MRADQDREDRTDHEEVWHLRGAEELGHLGRLIGWAATVFSTSEVQIEASRLYGTALLAHSIESARAIRLCIRNHLSGPAFALARTLYESGLRGHIIIHEIGLEELNELLYRAQQWRAGDSHRLPPPSIRVRGKRWKCSAPGTTGSPDFGQWHSLTNDLATRWESSIVDMTMLHDLTHGGMTQALQMMDEDGTIRAQHSAENQTRVVHFAERAVLFAIISWPGAIQTHEARIGQEAQAVVDRAAAWKQDAMHDQAPSR